MNFDALSRFLRSLEESVLPSCEMKVYFGGREVFAYSRQDKPLYLAYSLSKPLTCALALKYFEKGAFTLDDKLSTFLPAFRDMKVTEQTADGTKRTRNSKREILMRDLFTMSAGLDYDISCLPEKDTVTAVNALTDKPLLFDPGTRWNYSLCHDVLGAALEVIAGKRLRAIVKEELAQPLNLESTRFLSETRDEEISPLFEKRSGKYIPIDRRFTPSNEYDSGGSGIVTTLDDYSVFCLKLLEGEIISKHTLSLMKTDFLTGMMRQDFCWPQTRGYGYGLGVRVLTDKAQAASPSPVGEFGWGAISGSYSLMDEANGLCAVFMTHCLHTDEVYLFPRLRNVLYGCL